MQLKQRQPGGRLAAARLAHQPQRFTPLYVKGYIVQRMDRGLGLTVSAYAHGEMFGQIFHPHKGGGRCYALFGSYPGTWDR